MNNISSRMKRAALVAVAAIGLSAVPTVASAYSSSPDFDRSSGHSFTGIVATEDGGVWVQRDKRRETRTGVEDKIDPGTFAVNGAAWQGSSSENGKIIVADPASDGYYLVDKRGGIARHNSKGESSPWAAFELKKTCVLPIPDGSCPSWEEDYDRTLTAAATTPDGGGMFAVDNFGTVYTRGNAIYHGDSGEGEGSAYPPVAIVPVGKGAYYTVRADGGVFAHNGLPFFGSTGGKMPKGQVIVGMALSRNDYGVVNGYWLASNVGSVYTFGGAKMWGSTGGNSEGKDSVTGITALPGGKGYAIVAQSGEITKFTSDGVEKIDPEHDFRLTAYKTTVMQGETVQLTASVPAGAGGTAKFLLDDDRVGTVPVEGGIAHFEIAADTLGVGDHDFVAMVNSSTQGEKLTKHVKITVTKPVPITIGRPESPMQLVTVKDSSTSDGGIVDTWERSADAEANLQENQQWEFRPDPDQPGWGQLQNVGSGKCLQLNGTDGKIDQWTCESGKNHLWRFTDYRDPVTNRAGTALQTQFFDKYLAVDSSGARQNPNGIGLKLVDEPDTLANWIIEPVKR